MIPTRGTSGKTLRGSHDGRQSPIRLVSAFASEAGIALGQVKPSEKSNETAAIPELLDWLDVRRHFEQPTPALPARMARAGTLDKGHGRIEVRQCRLSTDIDWLRVRHPEWKNLTAIVAIDSARLIGDTTTQETRHFTCAPEGISSSLAPAARMLAAVRLHCTRRA